MTTANKRGGARPGAGRKALGSDTKKQTVAFRLPPELVTKLRTTAADNGITPTELVTALLTESL